MVDNDLTEMSLRFAKFIKESSDVRLEAYREVLETELFYVKLELKSRKKKLRIKDILKAASKKIF